MGLKFYLFDFRATKILTEMKNTFGFNGCHLLCINSSQDEQIEHQDNPWAPYVSYFLVLYIFFSCFEIFYHVIHISGLSYWTQ